MKISIPITFMGQVESVLKAGSGKNEGTATQIFITEYSYFGQPSIERKELKAAYCFTIHNSL